MFFCSTIYGGFSDGTIALWNVTSTSSILKKGKTLYPYRTFQAHHAGITGEFAFSILSLYFVFIYTTIPKI